MGHLRRHWKYRTAHRLSGTALNELGPKALVSHFVDFEFHETIVRNDFRLQEGQMRKWRTALAGISFAVALAGRNDHAICVDPHPGWRVAACPKRLPIVKGRQPGRAIPIHIYAPYIYM